MTSLSGRDAYIVQLIMLLKPQAASVRIPLTGEPGEVTRELERILAGVERELSHGELVSQDDLDSPLLAAQWVLGLQQAHYEHA